METVKRTLLLLLTTAFMLGAAGCDTEGPAEEAGEEIGQGIDEGGEEMERAIEPEQGE